MQFHADKQTLTDLNVLGKYNAGSLFSLFNRTITAGGEKLMDEMFRYPLTSHSGINDRCEIFRFFSSNRVALPFSRDEFESAEQYLMSGGANDHYLFSLLHTGRRFLLNRMGLKEEYQLARNGLRASILVLKKLIPFLQALQGQASYPFREETEQLLTAAGFQPLLQFLSRSGKDRLSLLQEASLDHLFRNKSYRHMHQLLGLVYRIDVAIAVGGVAGEKALVFPVALPSAEAGIRIKACRHPSLENAIGNDYCSHAHANICFLTGANMAGKSTFMKSVGAACYLAHMGFPVAAEEMQFAVKQGIFSSINVSDNLNQGISHFYAEVLRVKEVATAVCDGHNYLVIFDELFKGTNVKDAFDATLECTKAFGQFCHSDFIISTHIIEVGEELKPFSNVQFRYMPTVMKGHTPTYTYRMQEGITADRQGMMIIGNEGILEMME
ncbi:MAG: DNA mismatch repair protein [Chitinophagaceae bacterium]|nr:DNA mismatch repair protein [Chitinophagaceae bacterium]